MGRPVIGLETWEPGKGGEPCQAILRAGTPEEAVRLSLEPDVAVRPAHHPRAGYP